MNATTTMPSVTLEDVLSWKPCGGYEEDRLLVLGDGRESITAADVLELDIPAEDRLWAVLRKEMLPEPLVHEAACRFAEVHLSKYEDKYPGDDRPRAAIAAKRKWLRGEITNKQLSAARSAAWSAADSAARSAADSAAWSAARSAAWSAADSAAWSAARSAAKDNQIEIVKTLIVEHYGAT